MQAAGLISACIGLVLFLDGLRVCIMPLAEEVGQRLPQRLSLPLVMVVAFVLVSACRHADQHVQLLAPDCAASVRQRRSHLPVASVSLLCDELPVIWPHHSPDYSTSHVPGCCPTSDPARMAGCRVCW